MRPLNNCRTLPVMLRPSNFVTALVTYAISFLFFSRGSIVITIQTPDVPALYLAIGSGLVSAIVGLFWLLQRTNEKHDRNMQELIRASFKLSAEIKIALDAVNVAMSSYEESLHIDKTLKALALNRRKGIKRR